MTTQLPLVKKKRKKTVSEASTRNSVAENFESYTSKKAQMMEDALQNKREKDEVTKKLMATQLTNAEEKAYLRALRFFNEPHDHITNPVMREIILGKKREIAEKYGWPINF